MPPDFKILIRKYWQVSLLVNLSELQQINFINSALDLFILCVDSNAAVDLPLEASTLNSTQQVTDRIWSGK